MRRVRSRGAGRPSHGQRVWPRTAARRHGSSRRRASAIQRGACCRVDPTRGWLHTGVPGVISGKFSVGKIATKSLSVTRCDNSQKKDVVLCVTSHAERDVTVLDSKIGSVTPVYRSSSLFDNKAVVANRKFSCRDTLNPIRLDAVERPVSLSCSGAWHPACEGEPRSTSTGQHQLDTRRACRPLWREWRDQDHGCMTARNRVDSAGPRRSHPR